MNITIDERKKTARTMQNANVKASVNRKQKQAEMKQKDRVTSIQGDTVEISAAGKAASKNMGSKMEQKEYDEGKVIKTMSKLDNISNSQKYNLSSYSENELKQMYGNGEISMAEYNKELGKRESNTQ